MDRYRAAVPTCHVPLVVTLLASATCRNKEKKKALQDSGTQRREFATQAVKHQSKQSKQEQQQRAHQPRLTLSTTTTPRHHDTTPSSVTRSGAISCSLPNQHTIGQSHQHISQSQSRSTVSGLTLALTRPVALSDSRFAPSANTTQILPRGWLWFLALFSSGPSSAGPSSRFQCIHPPAIFSAVPALPSIASSFFLPQTKPPSLSLCLTH